MPLPATDTLFGLSPGMLYALGGSLILHGVVLCAIPFAPQMHGSSPRVMEARLLPAATASASVAHEAILPAHARPAEAPLAPALADAHIAPAQPDTSAAVTATSVSSPDSSTYFTSEQLDVPPHMLGEVQQIYPARARSATVEGYVTVALLINERGEVEDASVVQAQPGGYFEDAALAMLRKQRFSPPIKQNRAVKSRWLTTVRYRLQD